MLDTATNQTKCSATSVNIAPSTRHISCQLH